MVAGAGLNRWPFKSRSGVDVVEVRPRVFTDDAEAALRLAIAGAGIVRLSDVIVGGPLHHGELVPLLTDSHHVEPFPLAAIYPAGRQRLPRVAVFLEFLLARFATRPGGSRAFRRRCGKAGATPRASAASRSGRAASARRRSAMPSTRSGRKWRWKAVTTRAWPRHNRRSPRAVAVA